MAGRWWPTVLLLTCKHTFHDWFPATGDTYQSRVGVGRIHPKAPSQTIKNTENDPLSKIKRALSAHQRNAIQRRFTGGSMLARDCMLTEEAHVYALCIAILFLGENVSRILQPDTIHASC